MRKLVVFNAVSLDGFFTGRNGDLSWAHRNDDKEWKEFTTANAQGGGLLLFGRITYQMMASYWPTPQAAKDLPGVAEGINRQPKIVFSRTLEKADWNNTRVVKSDPAAEVRKLKKESGPDMVIMGSGTIISLLTRERLIDEYQIVLSPVVLGEGRTMFEDVGDQLILKRTAERTFKNGSVLLSYEPE